MRFIWPWQDRARQFSWLKASGFVLVLAPGVRMTYHFAAGEYGMLPIALGNLTYWSGVWATIVLLAALAVTPALRVLRWPALVDVRRMIGVAALAYTVGHIVIYFGLRSWNFGLIATDSVTRLTLFVAWLSTFGMIVLGATSLDAAIARMGVKSWQRLHNWNYAITALAVLHVVLARGNYTEQYLMAGLFFWVMVWRLIDRYGYGADVRALAILAVTSSLFTALLEAGMVWGRRGHALSRTLGLNFNPAMLEIGLPAVWQVLIFGFVFVLAAVGREIALSLARRRAERRQATYPA